MDSVSPSVKRSLNPFWLVGSVLVVGAVLLIGFRVGGPSRSMYKFVTTDRTAGTWQEGSNKWTSYTLEDRERIDSLAEKVRAELKPLGFTEDTSKRPWFRFVKGTEEVVVCYHNEFEIKPSKDGGMMVIISKRLPLATSLGGTGKWSTVLLKNGPDSDSSQFSVRKLLTGK